MENWYKEAIIYELHVKCFFDSSQDGIGDFKGLTQKLDYLQDLGVTAIWLLPFYPSPLKDDGYDISNYTDVHPSYGKLKDFRLFLNEAHRRGLKVITELVVNHTSDQHPWFKKARKASKGSRARDFYVWNEKADQYKDARIIFQDFETSNWTWDPIAGSYFWHRFYSHQPDLNFESPHVQKALLRILHFWMQMGVDGVRLDAVPYLYEREGTSCENLPETHAFLKQLRAYVDRHFTNRMLIAEANQWPEDAADYFGAGDECHMAFHFPVMPRLFMSIHLEDALPVVEILGQTPEIPENCQWALFLRNHDELTLEMVTDEERDYMFRVYAHDPQARLNLGIRRRLAPLLKNDRRKIELMNALLFSLTGTPVIYYGDEIGMGDNIYLGDRNGVRTPMQWSNDRNAGFSRAHFQRLYLPPIIDPEYHFETVNVEAQQNNPYSLLLWTKQLIALRKRFKAFGYGKTRFLLPENRKVLVFFREYESELILIIANLSRFPQYVELNLSQYNGFQLIELFSGQKFPKIGELPYFLTLGSYGYYWFALEQTPEESLAVQLEREREKQVIAIDVKQNEGRIFHPRMRKLLDNILKRYLYKRLHYDVQVTTIDRFKSGITDHFVLNHMENEKLHLIVIEVVFLNGTIERYPIFLKFFYGEKANAILRDSPENSVVKINLQNDLETTRIICDVTDQPETAETIKMMIQKKKRVKGEAGELRGIHFLSDFLRDSEIKAAGIGAQTEQTILKLYKSIEEGINVDIEMRLFLSQNTSFKQFLPLFGYVEYQAKEYTSALAIEAPYYNKEYTAKILAIEDADRFLSQMLASTEEIPEDKLLPKASFFESAAGDIPSEIHIILESSLEVSRQLGRVTASFHEAIASQNDSSDFAPVPFNPFYQRSLYQTARRKILEAFRQIKKGFSSLSSDYQQKAETVLKGEKQFLAFLHMLTTRKVESLRIRYHGDYCLEKLLYTGKEFLIINFEGKKRLPFMEKRYKRCALYDVASLILSLTDAAAEAIRRHQIRGTMRKDLEKWGLGWSLWNSFSMLRSYFRELENQSFLTQSNKEIDFFLLLFLLEQSADRIIECRKQSALLMLPHWLLVYEKIHTSL